MEVSKSKGFDEQEASMRMYNDEFDHFNKMPSPKHRDGDVFLKAALQEHDISNKASDPANFKNGGPKSSNGETKKGGREDSANGDIPKVYHNHGFQLQATEI